MVAQRLPRRQASQVWLYDASTNEFTQVANHEHGCRWPLWLPDGNGLYYVGGQSGAFNLWRRNLATGKEKRLTDYEDDSVLAPCLSRDGSTIVFRHLFDFYRIRPGKDKRPQRLKIYHEGDDDWERVIHRTLQEATAASFSHDGLEIAFIAGGDLWVMDTVLREPRQVTDTAEEERDPAFAPDGKSIYFVSDAEGQADIWKATRADEESDWWRNESFKLQRVTHDGEVESDLQFSPTGGNLAYMRGRGDVWIAGLDGKNPKQIVTSFIGVDYSWSPDGKWIAYSSDDNDFNSEVWIVPIDGSRPPFNLSQHPDNDTRPIWSPDGEVIAFTGRRFDTETDIYLAYLKKASHETGSRDRKLESAIEKIKKVREKQEKPKTEKKPKEVVIDFDDAHKRLRRVSIPDSVESGLFWSHDSKKLAFVATVDGKRGTYTISPPDNLKPKLLSAETGSGARWIAQGNQIVWLSKGTPGAVSATGSATAYKFTALQLVDVARRHEAAFDLCWRAMRDRYYDGALNNRNWDAIRRKYAPAAKAALDRDALARVVSLMLGELNGSHLGFRANGDSTKPANRWSETTAHLGLRFDPTHKGPGLKVRDVIAGGPTDKQRSRVAAGEIVLSIDGVAVDPARDLTALLNGPLARDVQLRVQDGKGEQRDVTLRPITHAVARALLYESWLADNQRFVSDASQGKLGYLHIQAMNMSSFYEFEKDLYAAGAGKAGLVIDVRENGGGFTTDHLLTALTQPDHAITVPRGGGPGYPQDRRIYATWNKPIVVLCNQNSFSNAEIFSHAIKTLKRGKLVGVPTAGAVISTGLQRIMDVGALRMPFRGWFLLKDGQDMELNGAVPHHVLWPRPGELPSGKDRQLNKAVDVLSKEVAKWEKRPQPKLQKASERK